MEWACVAVVSFWKPVFSVDSCGLQDWKKGRGEGEAASCSASCIPEFFSQGLRFNRPPTWKLNRHAGNPVCKTASSHLRHDLLFETISEFPIPPKASSQAYHPP